MERQNRLQQIVSPNPDDEGVWIHQNAWFHLGTFDKNTSIDYSLKLAGNGVYAFVLKGQFTIENLLLEQRDGLGITGTNKIPISAVDQDSEILIMEVPMKF
jgi:hypothetical protein